MREINELENFMKDLLAYAKTDRETVMKYNYKGFDASYQNFIDKYLENNDWLNEYFKMKGIYLDDELKKTLEAKQNVLNSSTHWLKDKMKEAFDKRREVLRARRGLNRDYLKEDPKKDIDYINMQDLFVNSYVNYVLNESQADLGLKDLLHIIGAIRQAPVKRMDYNNLAALYNKVSDLTEVEEKARQRLNGSKNYSIQDKQNARKAIKSLFREYVNHAADKYYDYTHGTISLHEGAPDIRFKLNIGLCTDGWQDRSKIDSLQSIIIDGREFSVDDLPNKVGSTVILDGWDGCVEMNEHGDYEWYRSIDDTEPCYRMKFDIQEEDFDSRAIIYDADGQRYPLNLSAEIATREKQGWEFECYTLNKGTIDNIIETYCDSNASHGLPSISFISSNLIEDNNCSPYYVAFEKGKSVFYVEEDGQYKKMEILGVENCKKVISRGRNEHTSDILSEDQNCIRYKVKTGDREKAYEYIYEYRDDQGNVCFGLDDYDDEQEPHICYTGTNRLFSNDNELLKGLFDTAYITNTTTNKTTSTANNTNRTTYTTNNSTTSDTSPRKEIKREVQRFDTSDLRQGANRSDEQSRARDEQTKEQNDRSSEQAKYEEIKRRRAEERKYSTVSREEIERRDAELERARAKRAEQEKAYRKEFGIEWDDSVEKSHSTQNYMRYDRGMSR